MHVTQIADCLRATPGVLRAQLSLFEEAQLSQRSAPDVWTVKEIIGHLIETDQDAFAGRIRLMLAEPDPELGGMDIHGLVVDRQDNLRPLEELLGELERVRAECADLVASLSEADLSRGGNYPKLGTLQVSDFVFEWPYHDCAHIQQIQHNLQELFVMGMGPIMREAVGR